MVDFITQLSTSDKNGKLMLSDKAMVAGLVGYDSVLAAQYPAMTKKVPFEQVTLHKHLKLGGGQFGAVVQATVRGDSTNMACKTSQDSSCTADLMWEAKLMARMVPHRHLVCLRGLVYLDDHVEQQLHGLLVDLVHGARTADRWIDEEFVSHEQIEKGIIHVLIGSASGLAHMHAHLPPLVHRDIAPRNVVVGADSEVRLLDYGLSRVAPKGRFITSQEATGYQKPTSRWPMEYFLLSGVWYPVSDTYMFGLMAIELFLGGNFGKGDIVWPEGTDVLTSLLKGDMLRGIIKPNPIPATAHPQVQQLVDACTQAHPKDRPLMYQVEEKLRKINKELSTELRPGGTSAVLDGPILCI